MTRYLVRKADALFHIVDQPGTALFRGEKPGQYPPHQHEYRQQLEKRGEFCIRLDGFNAGTIGRVYPVKESSDPEKRAIEEVDPLGDRFLHASNGARLRPAL